MPDPGRQPSITDVHYKDGHYLLTVISRNGVLGALPAKSQLVMIDSNGDPISSTALLPDAESCGASSLGARNSSSPLYVSGACKVGSEHGLFAYTVLSDWSLSDPVVRIFPGYNGSTSENALPTADGGLLIGGALWQPPGYFNHLTLLKVGPTGTVERDTVYGDSGSAICRQVTEWNGEPWVTVDGMVATVPASASYSAFRVTNELGLDRSFLMPRLGELGPPPPIPFDSILRETMDLVPISATRFASAGRFGGTWDPPSARVVVSVADTLGTVRRFRPISEFEQDFPPFLQCLAVAADGHFWFAMQENAQLGPPSIFSVFEPNRIHVYKLDTGLNVLCEHILDGSEDNTYYFLNRIKAMEDGGFILVGARRDLDDPSGYFEAWARKFATSDCSVGLTEVPQNRQAVLYPNPGRDGFAIVFEDGTWNGDLQLFDGTGRLVSNTPIRAGKADVDARKAAPGIYLYKARDLEGRMHATGRWVKE